MRFEINKAVLMHSLVTLIAGAGLSVFTLFFLPTLYSPLLTYTGSVIYGSREVRDLEKSHKWNFKTWNSAEFILPLITSTFMFVGSI